jgi:hypothetical protein
VDGEEDEHDGWAINQDEESQAEAQPEKAPASRRGANANLDISELRSAVNQIWPLLADKDPGAKDCFKDNKSSFRPAFSEDAFDDFERQIKGGAFQEALMQLSKAVRRYGIHI